MQVEKKRLHIKLDFEGDINHEILSKKLNKIIRQTFPAASLQLQFRTHPIIPQNSKDKLPSSTTSMCIYKFNCSCGSSYIGRTTRQLSKRIKEHNPAWLRKGLTKSIQSSIVQHLVDTGHQINTDDPSLSVIESHLGQPKMLGHDYYISQKRSPLKYLGRNYASKRNSSKLFYYLGRKYFNCLIFSYN